MITLEYLRQKIREYRRHTEKPKRNPTLADLAAAIQWFEGWYLGSKSWRHNNPGNLKWSPYQTGTKGGFAVFDTYEGGWNALMHQLRIARDGTSSTYRRTMVLYNPLGVSAEEWNNATKARRDQFEGEGRMPGLFQIYAPSSDGNFPRNYAEAVAKRLGVPVDYQIMNFA